MTLAIVGLAGLLIALSLVFGPWRMALAVMLVRPCCDRLFDWLKTTLDQPSGPGAALNALMIALAVLVVICAPGASLAAPVLAWAAFLLTALISVLELPAPAEGVRLFLTILTYAAAFIVPYACIRRREDAIQSMEIALYSSVIPTVVAYMEIASDPAVLTGEERLQGTFTHPNIFAFYLVGVLTVILFMACSNTISLSGRQRRVMFAYAALLLFLVLLTKTRSAWLAMLVIMAGYAIVVDRRWLVAMLALPIALLIPGVADRVSDLGSGTIDVGYERLNSFAWREVLWNDTIEWLASNPPGLFGYGLDSYQSYVPLFFSRGEGQTGVGPHNAFLQIYFEMGLAGVAAFLLVMATVALKLARGLRQDFAGSFVLLMLCAGYMIMFYSDNLLDYLQFQWFFWFVLGSACALPDPIAYPSRGRLAFS